MPLISKIFPKMERAAQLQQNGEIGEKEVNAKVGAVEEKQHYEAYDYSDFSDNDEYDDDESVDMEGNSILHRPRPRKRVPELPQRNKLRSSRILENLTIQLNDLEKSALNDLTGDEVDPLEHYLSSEEEAIESADEYDTTHLELDGSRPASSSSTSSYTSLARSISFMYVGKPNLISISLPKPALVQQQQASTSTVTLPLQRSTRRPTPLRLKSASSMSSLQVVHPTTTRSSSLAAPTAMVSDSKPPKPNPSFMSTSFIPSNASPVTEKQTQYTAPPVTPTSLHSKTKASLSSFISRPNFLSYDPYAPTDVSPTANNTANDGGRDGEPQTPSREHSAWASAGIGALNLQRKFSIGKKMRKASLANLGSGGAMAASSIDIVSRTSAEGEGEMEGELEAKNPVGLGLKIRGLRIGHGMRGVRA